MGYYFTLYDDIVFRSRYKDLTLPEECREDFELEKEGEEVNGFVIRPFGEEYYAKFNSYESLLKWISSVIAYDDYAMVFFTGDGGEQLDYRVFATSDIEKAAGTYNIFMVDYEPFIKGMPLDDFINKYIEENYPKK